eukprot:3646857-Karenia_brevis.AAC.1
MSEIADTIFDEVGLISQTANVHFFHVDAHCGHVFNEIADKMCSARHGVVDYGFFREHGYEAVLNAALSDKAYHHDDKDG